MAEPRSSAPPSRTCGLIDLIEAGDVDGAETFWREHLVQANRYLLEFPGSDRPLDLLD